MDSIGKFKEKFSQINKDNFEEFALALFRFQSTHNPIYRSYLTHLNLIDQPVNHLENIPFLPIEFFKTHTVKTDNWVVQKVFKSSGTTMDSRSQHFVEDLEFYLSSSFSYAEKYFGPLRKYQILALLPSYLEQGDSSLIEMVNHFIQKAHPESTFHLGRIDELEKVISMAQQPVLLIGVSYALLDMAEQLPGLNLSKHCVVETGGMKGRKKEITRFELHDRLKKVFSTKIIHSEYGMTELMSQAYGADGILRFPSWCRPFQRDINDPFDVSTQGTGALNIIDLANIHSCAFIETKDLTNLSANGEFEILGRLDNSDIRGCSLLI